MPRGQEQREQGKVEKEQNRSCMKIRLEVRKCHPAGAAPVFLSRGMCPACLILLSPIPEMFGRCFPHRIQSEPTKREFHGQ